jgi:O-6-methylguanine DNA methyltransferase
MYDVFKSPLGTLYLIFSGSFLVGLSFIKPADIPYRNNSAPKGFIKELTLYFQGSNSHFTQEVKFLKGTDFEQKVWSALKDIPCGETRPYKWIAEHIKKPSATRAVGQALSKNPIPIVVPCHRVIESDGSIGGYSSGIDIKRRLLEIEYYAKMGSK